LNAHFKDTFSLGVLSQVNFSTSTAFHADVAGASSFYRPVVPFQTPSQPSTWRHCDITGDSTPYL